FAADRLSSHEEAARGGSRRPGAARQVGLLLVEARRRGEARGRRRPERSVLLMATTAEELREEVRRRYAESARGVTEGWSCCGSGSCCSADFGEALYDAQQPSELPGPRPTRSTSSS